MADDASEQRRLAAIMFTDMVGYSALNESLALDLLREQQRLLRPILAQHKGREVKGTGDGFLVEFASALEAVSCAIEMQKALVEYNASAAFERHIQVRIGLHLGDVVVRDGDVFGDGVNIAARIEPLAEAGGICVSRPVYDEVQSKVEMPLVHLGQPELKNIAVPVEVYKVVLPWLRQTSAVAASSGQRRVQRARPTALALGLIAAALFVIGTVLVYLRQGTHVGPQLDPTTCCWEQTVKSCNDPACMECVCAFDDHCCRIQWDHQCALEAKGEYTKLGTCQCACAALAHMHPTSNWEAISGTIWARRSGPRRLIRDDRRLLAAAIGAPPRECQRNPGQQPTARTDCPEKNQEACDYASDLLDAFADAGWKTMPLQKQGDMGVVGVMILANPDDAVAMRLKAALEELGERPQARDAKRGDCLVQVIVGPDWK